MNGQEFYKFLFNTLEVNQNVGKNYTFRGWLLKKDKTLSLQFKISDTQSKSIPRNILVQAKEEYNLDKNFVSTEEWFENNNRKRSSGGCALTVLHWLLTNYPIKEI